MSPIAEIEGVRPLNLLGDLDVCHEDDDKTVLKPDNSAAVTILAEIIQQHPDKSLTLTSDIEGYVTVEGKTVPSTKVLTSTSRVELCA